MEKINSLIKELMEASQAYYQGEKELMTDKEYDAKLEYLEDLVNQGELELTDELSQLLNSVASGTTSDNNIVTHDYPMLSLGKAKNAGELRKHHNKLIKAGATGFQLEVKLDGIALSAKYVNGKLIQLSTRGDGVKGESLHHLINHNLVKINGLPLDLNINDDFELRGELYISDEQFKEINKNREKAIGELFSNPRNAVTGIVKRSQKGIEYKATITFTPYSIFHEGKQVDFNELDIELVTVTDITKSQLSKLSENYKDILTVKSHEFYKLEKAVNEFGILREKFTIPTDGVVIKPINEIEMLDKLGFTSRHPVANIAYKYPGVKSITTVKDIIVSVGKTGKLTPQAIVDPVEVDGVIIENITCHNYSWLNAMGIRVGSKVAVTRANDVIPAIDVVIDKGPNPALVAPRNCPECGEALQGDGTLYPKTLLCVNLECPSRFLYHMKSVVSRDYLYLEGLGDVALEALINYDKIKNIVDIFKIDEETLATVPTGLTSTGNMRQLGAGNAKNIMKSIESAKLNTDSNKLLASLNIEGMGPNTAKRLIAHFGGIIEVLSVDPERLTEVDQVGQTLVESFKIHGQRALNQLNELIELGFKINNPVKEEKSKVETVGTFSVSGSVFGFNNRNEFVKHMEKLGWEFHKSPKKDTDVLFADPDGASSKIKKAIANGTRIIDDLSDL